MKKILMISLLISTIWACKPKEPEPVLSDFTFVEGLNGEFTFTNKSTGATTYEWDFGGGKTSTEKDAKFTFDDNKSFTVLLTAKGDGGQNQKSKSLKVTTFDRAFFIANKNYTVLTGSNNVITPTPEQAAQQFKINVTRCDINSVKVQVNRTTVQSNIINTSLDIDSGCQVVETNSLGEYYISNSILGLPNQIDKAFVWKINADKSTGTFNINAYWNYGITSKLYWSITSTFK